MKNINEATSYQKKNNFITLILITTSYWFFMLSDGALRMLILLYFYKLGFSPITLAYIFLLYEFLGMITNLSAGWIAKNFGLKSILYSGMTLQILVLFFLSNTAVDWNSYIGILTVIICQGLSGIAKDLTKVSSKSAIRILAPVNKSSTLFHWTSWLTGSKNSIKGLGFFLGCLLLVFFDFKNSVLILSSILALLFLCVIIKMPQIKEERKGTTKLKSIFSLSTDTRINYLSIARLFLFGARDVWFVVGIPLYFTSALTFGERFSEDTAFLLIGIFMACWIILYGISQVLAPRMISKQIELKPAKTIRKLISILIIFPAIIVLLSYYNGSQPTFFLTISIVALLLFFGFFFALNSSLHSYLILLFSSKDTVTLNVGFYYMSNAAGRLLGTLLSGISFQIGGLTTCLAICSLMLILCLIFSQKIILK